MSEWNPDAVRARLGTANPNSTAIRLLCDDLRAALERIAELERERDEAQAGHKPLCDGHTGADYADGATMRVPGTCPGCCACADEIIHTAVDFRTQRDALAAALRAIRDADYRGNRCMCSAQARAALKGVE
jgi:hypothetical protein